MLTILSVCCSYFYGDYKCIMILTKSNKSHSRTCEIILDKLVQLKKTQTYKLNLS